MLFRRVALSSCKGFSFMRHWIVSLIVALMGLGFSSESYGQELKTQTIEQRAQHLQEAPALAIPHEEFIPAGEDGLVLLRRPKLFAIESNSSYQFTDNAFLSDKQKTHDHVLSQSVLVRVGTRIAQRVEVFASGSGFISRYRQNPGLDFNGVTGSAGASMPLDRWVMSLRYDGSAIYDRNFNAHLVTLHTLEFNVSATVGVSRTAALYPFFSVLRVWANPDDFSNTALAAGGTLMHSFTPTLAAFLQGHVESKFYDDFFEPSTLEARHDYGARLSATLNWVPLEWMTVNVTAAIARNESTISTLRYTNALVFPSLQLFFRF